MKWFRRTIDHWDTMLLVVIILAMVTLRITCYGNLTNSVAMNDTDTYIETASYSVITWQFWTAVRPPSVPLLYKIFQPADGFQLVNISTSALANHKKELAPQPGFEGIVLSQLFLSILGWSSLSWAVFRRLRSRPVRLAAALIVLLFAFTPQIADWDAILSSESLSFSLFALFLALSFELVTQVIKSNLRFSRWTALLAAAWLVILTFWVFTRDSNVYAVPVIILVLLAGIFLAFKRKQKKPFIQLSIVSLFLVILIGFQNITNNISLRWEKPFIANLIGNVLPYETRVNFFVKHGMPASHQLFEAIQNGVRHDDYRQFPEFMTWMKKGGYSTYSLFLLDTPLWASLVILDDLDGLLVTNLQSYFSTSPTTRPGFFEAIGNLFHPLSTVVILVDFLLTAAIVFTALRNPSSNLSAWAIIFVCLLLAETILLFVSYHGDYYSKNRHVLASLVPFRLSFWLLLAAITDSALLSKSR
jgi:hypothetical protein